MSSGIASGSVNILPPANAFSFTYNATPGNNVEVTVVTVAAGRTLYITGLSFTNTQAGSSGTHAVLVDDTDVYTMVVGPTSTDTQTGYPLFVATAGQTIEIENRTQNTLACNMWGFYL